MTPGLADGIILWIAVACVLVLRFAKDPPLDSGAPIYRAPIINPIIYCSASGFVLIRSATNHWTQALLVLAVFCCSAVAIRLLKANKSLA